MTKKKLSEILADENRSIFLGKGEIGEIFHRVRKILSGIGESETGGGNASLPQGGWTPLPLSRLLEEALYKYPE